MSKEALKIIVKYNYYIEKTLMTPILALRVERLTTFKENRCWYPYIPFISKNYFHVCCCLRQEIYVGNLYQRRIEFYVALIVCILDSRKRVCILHFRKIQTNVLYFSPMIQIHCWTLIKTLVRINTTCYVSFC
jgi:hypothetical protein